jgi:predicted peptidase
MRHRPQSSMLFAASALAFLHLPASAKVYDKSADVDGTPLHYKVALPKDYDPEKTYPGILAFPPGAQSMDMVLSTMLRNWGPEAERRGYIVVIPAAPYGQTFYREAARVFPKFIEYLLAEYKIRDNKLHIAGMSAGGRSAFHIAASYPQYFLSLTGFPGYLPDATPERVDALAKLCINMFVGELDTSWVEPMQKQAADFQAKGYTVSLSVEKGQGHVISTLEGTRAMRLFQAIEGSRNGCGK